MKIKLLIAKILLLLVTASSLFSQTDYSKPEAVAKSFLDLCLAGKRFEACRLYGTEGSNKEMEILLMQMVQKDIPLINDKCKYMIDSCSIDQNNNLSKCYYSKTCTDTKMNQKGFITLKKIDEEWRVEYIWKRDKNL